MRFAHLAAGLILAWLPVLAAAFEIEEERRFADGDEAAELRILSTADLAVFAPVVEAFRARRPEIAVQYQTVSSAVLYEVIRDGTAEADIAISSAMDLQTKLANDGYAQRYRSSLTDALPGWATWRNQLFAFTQEPAVLIAAPAAFEGLEMPGNRQDLIALLRDNAERFRGRVGTYDPRESGLGYLFATQDARQSEAFWRMAEVMGSLDARLYGSSGDMIRDVESGRLALAYNVLGSYVGLGPGVEVVELADYTHVMLRTALIPANAPRPALAGEFVDYLISPAAREVIADRTGLPPLDTDGLLRNPAFRPIRLGPGLMVFLDQLKRRSFLSAWVSAVVQP